MSNRETRKAFSKAVKGFQPPTEGWNAWVEYDIWSKADLGVVPMSGLKRFVANGRYSVQFYEQETAWGLVLQLVIRPHSGKPIRSWADMQRIKNELVGGDRTAIEVFPAEKQLVDAANCYHLWVLPEGFALPFGLHLGNWSQ